MACRIRYTPICGTGPYDPFCGLLELEEKLILLDCGWTEQCNLEHMNRIKEVINHVDAIVLTHGDVRHAGALAVLVAQGALPSHVTIISTFPVRTLTRLTLLELLVDKRACSEFNLYNDSHVAEACDIKRWSCARFYQQLTFTGGMQGIIATPFAAGHSLGGAVWRLTSPSGDDVVFAADWCHKRERLLGACLLPELFVRPAALLTDARTVLLPPTDSTKRDAEFIDVVLSTLRMADGSVLIPVDTTTRLLEVAIMLDELWTREKFGRVYPLVIISKMGRALLEAAQTQLEYMSDHHVKAFEMKRETPLSLKSVKLLTDASQLTQLQPGPKVILAGRASLESGPARQLFLEWAGNAQNTVCFVQRPEPGTLAHNVLSYVRQTEGAHQTLYLDVSKRVALEGQELEAWFAAKEQDEETHDGQDAHMTDAAANGAAASSGVQGNGTAAETAAGLGSRAYSGALAAGLSSALPGAAMLRSNSVHLSTLVRDPSGHMVQQLGPGLSSQAMTRAVSMGQQGGGAWSEVLLDGFEPPQGAAYPMFPDEDDGPEKETWDEYGIIVDHEPFKAAAAALSVISRGAGVPGRSIAPKRELTKAEMDMKEEEEDEEDTGILWSKKTGDESENESDDEDRPTKLVTEKVVIAVKAAIRFFNFDGLADTRFVRKAITDVAPQSLIVLHGSDTARQELANHADKELKGFYTRVLVPGDKEGVDASVASCYTLALSDEVQLRYPTHPLGRSGLMGAVVDVDVGGEDPYHPGVLSLAPHATKPPAITQDGVITPSQQQEQAAAAAGWLGDVFFAAGAHGVRLSELKAALASADIDASWHGQGALKCGPIIISKASLYAEQQQQAETRGDQQADQQAGSSMPEAGVPGVPEAEAGLLGRGHLVLEGAMDEKHDDLLQLVRSVIYTQFGAS